MTNLIVLALLRDRPMHGYEIQQLIGISRMDEWANLLSGSIYYALNKMEKDGLIRTAAEERTGARLRKIYEITDAGEQLFHSLVREALTITPHSVKSDFAVALNWIEMLPKEEALELLGNNLNQLEKMLAHWRHGMKVKGEYGLSPIAQASFENAIALLEQDIAYMHKVISIVQG